MLKHLQNNITTKIKHGRSHVRASTANPSVCELQTGKLLTRSRRNPTGEDPEALLCFYLNIIPRFSPDVKGSGMDFTIFCFLLSESLPERHRSLRKAVYRSGSQRTLHPGKQRRKAPSGKQVHKDTHC